MKFRPTAAFILMLLMLVVAVFIGAYRGWIGEKIRVEQTAADLNVMIKTRAESAYNLMTVAKRHLPANDEAIQAVYACWAVLADESSQHSLSEKAVSSQQLTQSAQALLNKLAGLDSVKQDSRDNMYVQDLLPQMLKESAQITAGAIYNQAAAQFNRELRDSYTGKLAMLLGVKPAQEFIVK